MRNGVQATMTKGERDDLIKIIKQRERVQKTAAVERSKELLAQFEQHLGTIYKFDRDEVWKAAMEAAREAVEKAQAEVIRRNKELGIPEEFAPGISADGMGAAKTPGKSGARNCARTRILAIEAKALAQIAATSVALPQKIVSQVHGQVRRFSGAPPRKPAGYFSASRNSSPISGRPTNASSARS